MKVKILMAVFYVLLPLCLFASNGEKIFDQHCVKCHHQISLAFGPSFEEIASARRSAEELQAYIISPESMYQIFGYEKAVMPAFENVLTEDEIEALSDYILSFDIIKF